MADWNWWIDESGMIWSFRWCFEPSGITWQPRKLRLLAPQLHITNTILASARFSLVWDKIRGCTSDLSLTFDEFSVAVNQILRGALKFQETKTRPTAVPERRV